MTAALPRVAIVAFNHFNPFHLSVPCLIFGSDFVETPHFELKMVAGEPGRLLSNVGMEIHPQAELSWLQQADVVIVPFWRSVEERPPQPVLDALRQAHERGALVVGLCLGGYLLAYSGLLSGKHAAMHWELEDDFSRQFPCITVDSNALYLEEDGLITSAGVGANTDCCLHIFQKFYGAKAANQLARRIVTAPHRDGKRPQVVDKAMPENSGEQRINQLLSRLQTQLSEPHSIDELAQSVMMTRRTFTRKFQQATGTSLQTWLAQERLARACDLLSTTQLPLEMVAQQSGFSSVAALRGQFKKRYGKTPNRWRRGMR